MYGKKVNLDGIELTNPPDISDAFNTYFTSIVPKLASKINIVLMLTLLPIFILQITFFHLTKLTYAPLLICLKQLTLIRRPLARIIFQGAY